MTNYFKHNYEPTIEEIRNIFPDFNYTTKEKYLEIFEDNYSVTPSELAQFAYDKLFSVTTSFGLSENQKLDLEKLIEGEEVNGYTGYKAYCNILDVKQIDYVGL